MDPFIEASGLWAGFHDSLITYLRESLQPVLPRGYYAEIRMREEVGVGGFQSERVIFPDVAVSQEESHPDGSTASDHVSIEAPQAELLTIAEEPSVKVNFLEIRDATRGDQLITLLEVLSPSNKQPGPDRDAFERKQEEVLSSETNWIEIDLLREGMRIACHPAVDTHCRRKSYAHSVVVSRAVRRRPKLVLELYGFPLKDRLPVISIPLRHPDLDVRLDLGQAFARAYDTGPYSRIIDYGRNAPANLSQEERSWVETVLRARQ